MCEIIPQPKVSISLRIGLSKQTNRLETLRLLTKIIMYANIAYLVFFLSWLIIPFQAFM